MAKKFLERNKWTIPSDWIEGRDGYMCYMICVPNSRQWRGVFDGQVSDLAYGRNWNKHTGSIIDNQEIAREIFESMCAQQCDDVIAQLTLIANGVVELGDKTGTIGQEIEASQSDGVISVGEGEQFPDQSTYFDAKCNVANGIFDTVLGAVTWLDDNNVDLILGLFGGVTSGLIAGLIGVGPFGWAFILTVSLVAGLAGFISRFAVSFSDLKAALIDTQTEAVLALYNATNTLTAESNFIAEVELGTPPITSVEVGLLGLMITADMVNNLFHPRDDMAVYQSPSPVDCGSGLLAIWSFPASGEGWLFRDDSTGTYSASGVWSSPKEAWEVTIVGPGTGTGPRAEGTVYITGLSIAIPAGGSVQMDHSGTGDGVIGSRKIKVIFSDMTTQTEQPASTSTASTIVMTVPTAKTISEIEVSFGRNWQFAFNTTRDCEEVRVFGI